MNRMQSFRVGLFILAAVGLFILLASNPQPLNAETKALMKPEIIVTLFYADWCPLCETIDPNMEKLANKYDGQPVLGVLLDVSNQTNRHHAELLASALGLDKTWLTNDGKTGVAYVVDAETGETLATLTTDDDLQSASAKVDAALKKASN